MKTDSKKQYNKPVLTSVKLNPEEAVLIFCKQEGVYPCDDLGTQNHDWGS